MGIARFWSPIAAVTGIHRAGGDKNWHRDPLRAKRSDQQGQTPDGATREGLLCRAGGKRMLKDVNRNPRRWVDQSRRVLVIEGWHPSEPSGVGYNVVMDGSWLGTFETLDGAAQAAAASSGTTGDKVALRPDGSGSAGNVETGLRLVPPFPASDT